MKQLANYIDGQFTTRDGENFEVFNPATHKVISKAPESSAAEVDAAISAAEKAQPAWAALAPIERAKAMRLVATAIRGEAESLARTISEEGGKTLALSRVEVDFTADYIDYMAEWARRIEGEIVTSDRSNETIFLFRQPIGVVAGILPWNFPFFLIARKLAPALVTGNTIVIKPSEEAPNNAYEFARLLDQCGLPPGIVNIVFGRGAVTGQALSAHPRVGLISFTGSVETGSKIMAAAAANITKVNLELGGKAPAIVMADADIETAVQAIKSSRVINTGQVCNCAERVYVHAKVADEFTSKLTTAMEATKYGDPLIESDLDMGPLISERAIQKVESLVQGAINEGATALTGAKRAGMSPGWHYEPTVLADCRHDMEIIRREVFGPVVPIVTVSDLDEAIACANDSDFGLTSSIYTRDINVAMRACREIRFGETYINRENFEAMQGFHAGWRKSGIGGADGKHGLYEYMQTHVVYLQHDASAK